MIKLVEDATPAQFGSSRSVLGVSISNMSDERCHRDKVPGVWKGIS